MNKTKKYILFLLLLTAIVIIFINLTDIVISLPVFKTTGILKETDINQNNVVTEYYRLETSRQIDNLIKTVEINGWAFLGTNDDNPQKTITLALKDIKTGKIYEVKTDVYSRPDVYEVYCRTVNIQGNQHGFSTYFSPLKIPDGIYHMLLHVQENASTSGLIFTDEYFIKNGGSFKLYQPSDAVDDSDNPADLQDINTADNAKDSESVNYFIDRAIAERGYLAVHGWAFIKGQDTSETPVYLLVENNGKSAVYSTIKTWRADVGAYFKNELYTQSGFSSNIPLDGLSGKINITVIADQYRADSKYELTLG